MTKSRTSPKLELQKLRRKRDLLIKNREWESLLDVFNRMIEIKPTVKRLCNRNLVLLQLGCLPEALEGYQRALALDPSSELARKGIAKVKAMMKQIEQSTDKESENEGLFCQENDQNPSRKETELIDKLNKSKIEFISNKDWDGILAVYDQLIALRPTAKRYCHRGILLLKLSRLSEALDNYRKALELAPGYTEAKNGIEQVRTMLQSVEQATREEPILAMHFAPRKYPGERKKNIILGVLFFLIAIVFVVMVYRFRML